MVFVHSWRKKICRIGLTVNKSTLLHYTDTEILNILRDVKTIAMVGASANAVRPSNFAMKYLLGKGYDIIPINPKHAGQKILGQVVYNSLSDVPRSIDMVDIFRSSEMVTSLLEEILTIRSKKEIKVVWMQLGVRNDKAAKIAKAAHKNGTTLKHEVVKSGALNEKEYDKIMNPVLMTKPK